VGLVTSTVLDNTSHRSCLSRRKRVVNPTYFIAHVLFRNRSYFFYFAKFLFSPIYL